MNVIPLSGAGLWMGHVLRKEATSTSKIGHVLIKKRSGLPDGLCKSGGRETSWRRTIKGEL